MKPYHKMADKFIADMIRQYTSWRGLILINEDYYIECLRCLLSEEGVVPSGSLTVSKNGAPYACVTTIGGISFNDAAARARMGLPSAVGTIVWLPRTPYFPIINLHIHSGEYTTLDGNEKGRKKLPTAVCRFDYFREHYYRVFDTSDLFTVC